jgi:hypothetical protein
LIISKKALEDHPLIGLMIVDFEARGRIKPLWQDHPEKYAVRRQI